jgi:glyoxylase-like metal-dependent hydrolase (beta-lactamase superfamily II)
VGGEFAVDYHPPVPPSASTSSLSLREIVLSPRLVVLTLGGDRMLTSWGTNCVAFAAAAGTLVVDPMIAPAHARLVEEALRRRGFPEVRHVVLTHHHTDHALGAAWFAARGAAVVAHVRCAEEIAAQHPAIIASRRLVPELATLFAVQGRADRFILESADINRIGS